MTEKNVPKATLQRYPVYLKALRKLKSSGVERIMSKELASVVNIEPTTIRRDFSFLGNLGKQGYGYDVNRLIEIFNQQLGMDFDEKIILVGAGNMGRALMKYNKWDYVVGEIACAFDVNPHLRLRDAFVVIPGIFLYWLQFKEICSCQPLNNACSNLRIANFQVFEHPVHIVLMLS